MPETLPVDSTIEQQRDRYVDHLIEAGSSVLLPDLCARSVPDAMYHIEDRAGLGVVAVPEHALCDRHRDALSRFRFAQYLAAGFIDQDVTFRQRLDHDVLVDAATPANGDTLHFIVFASGSGHLLASMCLLALPQTAPEVRVGSCDRALFPVEEHFGWGAFNRLALVPDTPINRVREFGRLVKNPRHASMSVGPRAVIELCMAASRLLLSELATTVDVCLGEFETNGVRRNLEFFHTPMVVLDGGLPVFPHEHPLNAALEGRDRYPFAFLVSDLTSMQSRLDAIEAALAKPDPDGVRDLAELKRIPYETPSALVPPQGIPALANTPLPQRSIALPARRQARELGRRLRRVPAFAGLSDTECTTLRRLGEEKIVAPGQTVLARHQVADALIVVEEGRAELRLPDRPPRTIAGPGECIGTAGVLAGAQSPGDIVARTSLHVLRLPAATCAPVLRELPDVERKLQSLALTDLLVDERGQPATSASKGNRLATNSAEAMASLRAAGAVERNPALRNPDHMAGAFLTPQLRVHALAKVPGARRLVPALAERLVPGAYHYETARVKHIDAILCTELRKGLDQLVLLGAGYDSRPYRFAGPLRHVHVLEVDQAAISQVKRRKAARVLGQPPSHVTFVESDFTRDDVTAQLSACGHHFMGATLVILSGVTPYLPAWAVERLFMFVARHGSPRTSVVFDYVFSEMIDGDDTFRGAAPTRRRLAALGEPLRFGIAADGVARYVEAFGLTLASDLRPAELARRYLCAADGSIVGEPYGFAAIAHARVPPRGELLRPPPREHDEQL